MAMAAAAKRNNDNVMDKSISLVKATPTPALTPTSVPDGDGATIGLVLEKEDGKTSKENDGQSDPLALHGPTDGNQTGATS